MPSAAGTRLGTVEERAAHLSEALDLVGVGLVAAFAGWIVLVSLLTGGDPGPALAVTGAGLLTFGAVRAISGRAPRFGPTAVLLAGALLPLLSVGGTVASGQPFGPLRYANASALFYVVVAAAGGMLAARTPGGSVRFIGILALIAAATAVLASRSEAAIVLLLILPVAALARRPRGVRLFLSCAAALVVAAVATTIVLGTLRATSPATRAIEGVTSTALTARRLDLWRDALDIAARDPITGVGPGGFRSHSPTARHDKDAVAVHNEYLQAAAELGLPGLLLAVTLPLWGFARLRRQEPDASTSFAGAALAAVGVHASVDYVLHAPAIVIAAAALVGAASAASWGPPTRASGAARGRTPAAHPAVAVTTAAPTSSRGSLDSRHPRR